MRLRSSRLAVRTADELRMMRAAGRVVAEMHEAIRVSPLVLASPPTISTCSPRRPRAAGATPNFLGYGGFPGVICASVNDELIHGIPGPAILEDGDVLCVDCGAIVDGWHGDAAFTMGIGQITPEARRLIQVAEAALAAGIAAMQPGGHLEDIGAAVDAVVPSAGLGSPWEYSGHGIGRAMHEHPDVENRGRHGRGPLLEPGVVLAVEPMVIAGGADDVVVLDDNWTVVTADGSLAAHVEHTIAVTADGPEILTRL